ncbi:MAG: hypothetical protein QOC66_4133, partial [Pseudonocardiales bacterium]|nr:hypothetical protein [Pseudonocardiales bacterium]
RNRSIELYRLPPERVHVAPPGVDAAEPAAGSPDGGRLLCVGAVAPHKGQDVLLAALALTADRPWCCALVGPADPDFLELLRRRAAAEGIDDRLHFADALTGDALDRAYAGADVLVLASRGETYGMVVIEALARGLPVIATAVGGVPEALGHTADGRRPGLLVAPDDPGALATALRSWSTDPDLRQRLRRAAADRRPALAAWDVTTDLVARALTAATTMP